MLSTKLLATLATLATLSMSLIAPCQAPLGGVLPQLDRTGSVPAGALAVEIHDSGLMSMGGIPVLLEAFAARVAEAKDGDVLVRADRGLPAQAVAVVLEACAAAGAARLWLGVAHPSGQEGAFALFLARAESDVPGEALPLLVSTDDGASSAQELTGTLQRYLAAMGDERKAHAVVEVVAPGDLAWGRVLPLLGAVHAAEVSYCSLRVEPSASQADAWRERDVRGLVAATDVVDDIPGLSLGPVRIAAIRASRMARPVSAKPVGFMSTTFPTRNSDVVGLTASGERPGGEGARVAVQMIDRGLAWLAQNQTEAGYWDASAFGGDQEMETGATGLALLALLANGNTLANGPYAAHVRRAAGWLADQQQASGLIGRNLRHDFVYGHAIATWALVEAAGLSGDAAGARAVREAAQLGLNYLESHRNPYMVWRYQPRDNDNDTSVTTWCVAAISAGRSFDFEINPNAPKLAALWYDQVADPATGRHGYTKRGELSARHPGDHARRFPPETNETMTAAALAGRYFLGQTPDEHPIMRAASALLASKPPRWDERAGTIDYYAWFWGTLSLYQTGGRLWNDWQGNVRRALQAGQSREGEMSGSWEPVGVWCEDGGRVYSTALALLSLQAVYRYSRLIR